MHNCTGKLSKVQIQKAMGVLTELSKLIENENPDQPRVIDANNRFYTFIPHSFGVKDPPLITDLETIKKKTEMLDSLMELEIAYSLMKTSSGKGENSIDAYYSKLNTEIDVLDRASAEFEIIQEYVRNTHAATHSSYSLEIEEVGISYFA